MKGKLGDRVRLQHILAAIREVATYLNGITYQQFLSNSENVLPLSSK